MKILLSIHEALDPNSGAAGSTLKLGQEYEKLGHEVTYFSFNNLPIWLPKKITEFFFPEFFVVYLLKYLRKERIDIIDASTGDAWLWGKLLKKEKFSPLLVTRSHNLEHCIHLNCLEDARRQIIELGWKYKLYRGSLQLWEVSSSLRSADLVFLLNRVESDYAIHKLGIPPDQVHIVANGISNEFLNLPFINRSVNRNQSSKILIALVGSYIPRKGIKDSVPALKKILEKFPQVQISFLGTWYPMSTVYADFEACFHNRIKVVQHYQNDKLPQLLAGHDIFLFPSSYEAFGKALIEAMACGLAPITTNAAGPLEIVTDGQDAIMIPIRDQQAIENSLTRLITDQSLREKLRFNAYISAQRFSWSNTAKVRLNLYKTALSKKI